MLFLISFTWAGIAVLALPGVGLLLLTALAALVIALLLTNVGGLVVGIMT